MKQIWGAVPIAVLSILISGPAARPQPTPDTVPQPPAPLPAPLNPLDLSRQPLPGVSAEEQPAGDPEMAAAFRRAMQAIARRHYQDAITELRWMLSRDPSLVRVRLELARAFFLAGDYDNAEYHFNLARTEPLPPAAIANIDRFLAEIEARRPVHFRFRFDIAPDTNINAATSAHQITLFGLPFILNDDAREKSGVGLSFNGAMIVNVPLAGRLWFASTVSADFTDYSGGDFDDLILSFDAGPSWHLGRSRIGAGLIGSRRIYGGDPYSRSFGGQITFSHPFTDRLALSGVVAYQDLDYDGNEPRNGDQESASLQLSYGFNSYSFGQVQAGIARTDANSEIYANTSYRLGAGYYREFSQGFSFGLNGSVTYADYDGASPIFGVTDREDWQYRVQADLGLTRFTMLGFSPVFTYIFTDNESNIELYTYDRHQFLLGLRKIF